MSLDLVRRHSSVDSADKTLTVQTLTKRLIKILNNDNSFPPAWQLEAYPWIDPLKWDLMKVTKFIVNSIAIITVADKVIPMISKSVCSKKAVRPCRVFVLEYALLKIQIVDTSYCFIWWYMQEHIEVCCVSFYKVMRKGLVCIESTWKLVENELHQMIIPR